MPAVRGLDGTQLLGGWWHGDGTAHTGPVWAVKEESVPRAQPRIERYPMTFSGAAGEYFRIWIVNVFLTIVTLGFMLPGPRYERRQYFYANTHLAGQPFRLPGQPAGYPEREPCNRRRLDPVRAHKRFYSTDCRIWVCSGPSTQYCPS